MKIYKNEPPYLVRLQIRRKGDATEYLTLCAVESREQVRDFINKILSSIKVPVTASSEKITGIYIREAVGAKNGKSISVSLRGLSPKEVLDLIVKNISDERE